MSRKGVDEELPSVTLYCCESGSDKVYRAEVAREGDGYVVRFAYGRRGAALKAGTKTSRPISRENALEVYERLVREKRGRGYVDAASGEALAAAPDAARGEARRPRKGAARGSGEPGAALDAGMLLRQFAADWDDLRTFCDGTLDELSVTFRGNDRARNRLSVRRLAIVDEVFGVLVWGGDYTWSANRSVPEFDGDVRLCIDVPNARALRKEGDRFRPLPPTAAQREAFRTFIPDAARHRRTVEDINWRYYTRYRNELLDEDDPDSRRLLPNVRDPAGVWRLLSRPSITVPVQPKSGWWIELCWECRWDPEHGHKVVLRNGKENYVGQQGGG
jgi:predicted DNA-binding WGR domain protein